MVFARTHHGDGCASGNGHVKCPFLEATQATATAAGSLRKHPDALAFPVNGVAGGLHGGHSFGRTAAIQDDVASQPEYLPEEWHPNQ